jgi:hypothetical protein
VCCNERVGSSVVKIEYKVGLKIELEADTLSHCTVVVFNGSIPYCLSVDF